MHTKPVRFNDTARRSLTGITAAVFSAALLTVALPARAGDVLFVSDSATDAINIPLVLSGGSAEVPHGSIAGAMFRPAATPADHDVTIIRNDYMIDNGVPFMAEGTNLALKEAVGGVSLADYCAVYWSASGPHEPDVFNGGFGTDGGLHDDPAVYATLNGYVANGGFVFVTGHDAVTDPMDLMLEGFVGGSGAVSGQVLRPMPNSAPFAVTSGATNNALTTGEVDIRLVMPGAVVPGGVNTLDGVQDQDYLAGVELTEVNKVLAEATVMLASQWTERIPIGLGGVGEGANYDVGRIAYVANGTFLFEDLPFNPGVFLSDGEDASWVGDPVYNGALRNFAFNACTVAPPPDAPTNLAGRVKRNRVNLTWTASASGDADQYLIYRMLDSEMVFNQVGSVNGTVYAETLPGGTTSADYYVIAENASGQSGPSNTVTVMPNTRMRR